jgi:crotonobetainyl-CoA:carnitine CoA-transferase CaiB-like acyl-CoA transferase
MISRADVFVQNLAPGACARLGLDSDTLSSLSPALITCDISGYGEEGPYRDMKAYDLLVQCEAGLASITGTPDAPGRVGVSISDIGCGMNAYAGILRALLFRGATGRGSNVAVALFDTVAEWMCVPYLHARAGAPPQRVGIAHPSIAPYGQFRTAEGSVIVIAVQNDREWSRLSRAVLQRDDLACNPAFANNHARVANRQELDALIADVMATLSIEVAAERLRTADIAFGFVNDVLGLARHPHLRLLPVANLGSVDVIAPAVRVRGERSAAGRVPQLNEHGAEIRREFG